MNDLFDNVWGEKQIITTDHAIDITLPVRVIRRNEHNHQLKLCTQIALFVIGVAGFGRRLSWEEDLVIPPGHDMAFKVGYIFAGLSYYTY